MIKEEIILDDHIDYARLFYLKDEELINKKITVYNLNYDLPDDYDGPPSLQVEFTYKGIFKKFIKNPYKLWVTLSRLKYSKILYLMMLKSDMYLYIIHF